LVSIAALAGCTGKAAPPLGSDPPPRPTRSSPAPAWLPPAATPAASAPTATPAPTAAPAPSPPEDPAAQKARIVAEFAGRKPRAWGQSLPGILTRAVTEGSSIALTFDACGGPGGDDYDAALIDHLRREHVPATLFVTSRWIAAQRSVARSLAADPLFEIENHGGMHRPCSVTGRSAYDIRGTRSVGDAIDEIQRGARAILELTGRAPRFYRPGTAYFDDVCLDVVGALGESAAGFAVNGDGGTGFSRAQVRDAIVKAKDGSVVLLHMNHPSGQTAEGVMDALPILRARGTKLVRLADVTLK
jgi:peptidoglycan/xylan/chitin deacetylase (PgdA/CDA1 family)